MKVPSPTGHVYEELDEGDESPSERPGRNEPGREKQSLFDHSLTTR